MIFRSCRTKEKYLSSKRAFARGFTLIELVVVIIIIAVIALLVGTRTGTFGYWNDEAFLRKLSETISFLHYQALADQSSYQLEIDMDKNQYRIGILKEDEVIAANLASIAKDVGIISLELAAFLNPSTGNSQSFIPPPDFPSLADPVPFPPTMKIEDVMTMRGKIQPSRSSVDGDDQSGVAYIRFSPRGFSEFAVIHLKQENGASTTILVNPFTGKADIIRGYREFEWTYGRKKKLNKAGKSL